MPQTRGGGTARIPGIWRWRPPPAVRTWSWWLPFVLAVLAACWTWPSTAGNR
ncbi:hypothetical protein J2S46_006688 [Kitasatospora herbaricolor]|uniref:hypothetical protein n=1 Tax=Kitasatospora herbaricolor TaxID=68217 RepID=UPI00174D78DC|nr:hypothetical protein [Kitasatospora herbaricolor]MDQ0312132.1 hypothetical protein [Kitasatospora herbaricolor]